jgi:CBS domain-containing protein
VARRNGLAVEGITLWLLGGVARFEGEPASPGAELRIAGSGPLVSLILGVGFGVAAAMMTMSGLHGLVTGCLAWLAAINVALAAFNVIPAAPLDGGRLVHALVWRLTGDATKATLRSAQAGRVFGWLLAIGGFALSPWNLTGLWLALVGWFIVTAASLEEGRARARARLEGITVGRIMTPDPFTVPSSMTVASFRREMLPRHRHAVYPVVDDGTVRGVVTAERVRTAAADVPLGTLAEDASQVPPAADLAALLPRLTGERLLVVDAGRLVGIVTPHDLTCELDRLARDHHPW